MLLKALATGKVYQGRHWVYHFQCFLTNIGFCPISMTLDLTQRQLRLLTINPFLRLSQALSTHPAEKGISKGLPLAHSRGITSTSLTFCQSQHTGTLYPQGSLTILLTGKHQFENRDLVRTICCKRMLDNFHLGVHNVGLLGLLMKQFSTLYSRVSIFSQVYSTRGSVFIASQCSPWTESALDPFHSKSEGDWSYRVTAHPGSTEVC